MEHSTNLPHLFSEPELETLIRQKDWSQTAIGPVAGWSASLRFAVQMILSSGFPMAIRWGPDFVMIYNDGYRAILGEKHPHALGQTFAEAWPEVQADLRDLHDAILSGERRAFFAENFPLRVQRRANEWDEAKFTISYGPIHDDTISGGIGGILITVVETTERALAETALRTSEGALRESELNLRLVLDSATDAVYCVNKSGETTLCNLAFLRMLNIPDESAAIGRKLHDVIHHTHPDGTPYPKEECPIYKCASRGEGAHIDDENFYRLDGTCFPVEYWVAPIVRDGELQGAVCTFVDITERRRDQDRQLMLLGELNHRVKNVFALTSSMVMLSARSAKSVKELASSIRERLSALSTAHTLVLPRSSDKTVEAGTSTLRDLLEKLLAPYDLDEVAERPARTVLEGPDVSLGSQATTNLALVLHELGTNSAKYGALSCAEGCVQVFWKSADEKLMLTWQELGGPRISGAPATTGFGTLLSKTSVQGDFDGTVDYDWQESGLCVKFQLATERLAL